MGGGLRQTAAHKFQKFENNNKYFSRADRNYFKSPAAPHLSLGPGPARPGRPHLLVSSASQAGRQAGRQASGRGSGPAP